jgi:hypothetical protein
MRDWKVFRPDAGGTSTQGPVIRKRRSSVDPEIDDPQFEIALDVNAEQLTLLFDDAVKYEERSAFAPYNGGDVTQEQWRREALREKQNRAEGFGPWIDESRVEDGVYYRKASRLADG